MLAASTFLQRATSSIFIDARSVTLSTAAVFHRWASTSAGRKQQKGGKVSASYRLPIDQEPDSFHPLTHQQKRFASRVELALALAINKDLELRDHLLVKYGFEVHRIRPSTDRSTVHLLWDCYPNKVDSCRRFIQYSTAKIRHVLASTLGAKRVPYLEFVHDRLPPEKVELQHTLDKVEMMMHVESTMEPDPVAAAAIKRLSQAMRATGSSSEDGHDGVDVGDDSSSVEAREELLQEAIADLAEFDDRDELDNFELQLDHDPMVDSRHNYK